MEFEINKLVSGGIMATYHCSAKCLHCRHNASPEREKRFISEEMLDKALKILDKMGCTSVHIEGGESFLFPDELKRAVKQITESNISLEHVITNCSWYRNQKETITILKELQKNGLRRLLLKVGPFQNASIPLKKVQNVAQAAEKIGLSTLIWDSEFYPEVAAFDTSKTHPLKKYIQRYGDDYVKQLAHRFNITFSGRSFAAYEKHLSKTSVREILRNDKGCQLEMAARYHFHIDLDGNFCFPYTQGLTINIDDIDKPIKSKQYFFVDLLFREGIAGLYKYAKSNFKFEGNDEYLSKCHLCHDIRSFLVNEAAVDSPDLRPIEFYSID